MVVLTTTNSQDLANTLADDLVRNSVAACVNIIPNITSVYKWKGEVCRDTEWLLVIKTSAGHFERLRERLRARHSYDVPEVIALPVVAGDAAYLNWLTESIGPPPAPPSP